MQGGLVLRPASDLTLSGLGYNGEQGYRSTPDINAKQIGGYMNRFLKPIQAAVFILVLAALTSCSLGQPATPATPTVDVEAVKTAAAATAIVELTSIAAQASPTPAPTQTPTTAPATPTLAATTSTENATQGATVLATATVSGAAGLPATETPAVAPMAGTPAAVPSLTSIVPAATLSTGPTCLNSKFVADITIPDGTVMKPGEKFTKAWRVQNTGTCPWDEGFGFIRWSGPAMNSTDQYFSKNDQPVGPGGVIDFYVDMRAPYQPGDYVAHWVMVSDSGKTFGGDFTVVIKVTP